MNECNCPQKLGLKNVKWLFQIYPKLLGMEKTKDEFKKRHDQNILGTPYFC